MAWIFRNLVELQVWVEYCSKSVDQACDFCRDAVRDVHDLYLKIGDADPATLEELEKTKAFMGTAGRPHAYKHVADAAREVGLKKAYAANCKLLSKYVHPTAVSLLAPFRGESANKFASTSWRSGATSRWRR